MPFRMSSDSSTLMPLYATPRWSRIWTTWPENPHIGNCGVPFMNSTTSLPLTSLSMNCSMAIASLMFGRPAHAPRRTRVICSVAAPPAQGVWRTPASLFRWCVESAFDLEYIVLIEAVDLDDGARRIRPLAPKLLLHLVHQRSKSKHVGDVDHDAHAVAQARPLRFDDHLHVEKALPDARLLALDEGVGRRVDAAHAGDIDEVTGARAEAPGSGGLDRAGRLKRLDALRRLRGGKPGRHDLNSERRYCLHHAAHHCSGVPVCSASACSLPPISAFSAS